MTHTHRPLCRAALLAAALLATATLGARAEAIRIDPATDKPTPDLSGKSRVGKASFYAKMFAGRTMADGKPMNPEGDNAASRTLPLGTIARVTNVSTGQSAMVTIQDRGPYVQGRLVDLSPATARTLGITPKMGLAMVEVTPIFLPLPDGRIRFGDGPRVARTPSDQRAE